MDHPLLDIALYFDERTDPETLAKMSMQVDADRLFAYPPHYFNGKHDITLHHPPPGARGFLVLYNHLVNDPHIDYLQGLKAEGYIKFWAVFPPGAWKDYFKMEAEP